jgi:hypothetical protein
VTVDVEEARRHLHSVNDGLEQLATAPSLEEMWEAVPLNVELAVDPDDLHDPADPCLQPDGKRRCISTRRAGGRCTAQPGKHSLLCNMHSGLIDPAEGGRARAQKARGQQIDEAEQARLRRLGTRGVIADTMAERPDLVRAATLVLLEDAAKGDRGAAKLLGPMLNQAHGMPTERVMVTSPESVDDLDAMDTAQLESYVETLRAQRQAEDAA